MDNLNKVKKYESENNKLPPQHNKDKEVNRLGGWIANQKINYKNHKMIMKNKVIYDVWSQFINDEYFKKYFID